MNGRTSLAPFGTVDEYENFARRHRHGRTLAELHREADLELADEGGIAPLDDEVNLREPKPLKDYPPQWDVIATWAVIGLSTALLLGVFVHFVAQGLRADSGAVPAAQFSQGE